MRFGDRHSRDYFLDGAGASALDDVRDDGGRVAFSHGLLPKQNGPRLFIRGRGPFIDDGEPSACRECSGAIPILQALAGTAPCIVGTGAATAIAKAASTAAAGLR